ncbi:MAG: ABC transporter substrate-binding protein [Desulfobacterales bacterium]|nr:ABC transporter substrate-binding protein [Desulfobacterales bacterium]
MQGKIQIVYRLIGVLLIIASTCGWACIAEAASTDDSLTYRLKWLFNASVVGDIYADVNGAFAAEGLKVSVKEGGPERDAIKELELGYAQFGVASADQVIRARSKGAPVVVVAQLFQINPLQWIYRSANFKIKSLQDLKGRILGVTFGGNDEAILRTLLAKGGLSEDDVTLFSVRYDYTPFYKGKTDIWPVYRNTQAVFIGKKLRDAGEEIAFFNPADFGVRFVANSVVTSERMMKEQPGVVERFTRALIKGWEDALDPGNEQKALETLRKFDKDTPDETLGVQLGATRILIKPSPEIKIGTIDVEAWKATEKIMLEQKQISEPVHIEKTLR